MQEIRISLTTTDKPYQWWSNSMHNKHAKLVDRWSEGAKAIKRHYEKQGRTVISSINVLPLS